MSEINALNQTAQSDTEFVLTDENYYSAEANQLYLSNSMFNELIAVNVLLRYYI